MRRRRRSKGNGGFWRGVGIALLMLALFAVGSVAGMVASYARNLPDISRMADYQPASSTRIFARDGTLLASVYKENRVWVPISRVPPIVRDAFVANEDHNFYNHHGVDLGSIVRAAFADLTHQEFQGASTITQQLARRLFLNDQVSLSRKVQEALLAIEIERYYTKDEILERYLNIIYLGAGAYGVDAAAHTYFGRGVDSLTLAQAAMLAGIVAAPSDYSPFSNYALARSRQRHVLDRMVESGYATVAQADAAYDDPLGLISEQPTGLQGYRYPYFTTYAIAQLERVFGTSAVEEGGLQAYTTLDARLQEIAQEAVTWGVGRSVAEGIGAHQAALVALRPSTGEILAMVGGTGFTLNNQFNRAWQARRQPGSSFKIYDYTAAIDSGMPASTVIDDTPVSYPMGDGTNWSPMDDDHSYMGAISLREAVVMSRNVVAVKLAERIGLDKIIGYAHRMGVTSPLEANLSLALGSSGVSVLDQASGYSTLADQGLHIDPTAFRMVKDAMGSVVLDDRVPQATDVVSAGTAYIMTSILEDVIAHGTGYPNAVIDRPAAGKTGTTSNFRDAWFVGYTPDLVTAVWLGNDNYTPMNESYGGNIPARIWARFMKAALANTPKHEFPFPSDEVAKVAGCGRGNEYYLRGTEPESGCGGSIDNYEAQQDTSYPEAASLPQPTVPPASATPPPTIPPLPTESPLESPSPEPTVERR
ncbi:MAG TPA: transglycosylase domain-containing protein [Candidatus Acidoferrales bacterium]|jgi:penicillin-binding protein 1A|nr:transglycosylase domain-containing protein [Candidatus Acidoferrales bacterium]